AAEAAWRQRACAPSLRARARGAAARPARDLGGRRSLQRGSPAGGGDAGGSRGRRAAAGCRGGDGGRVQPERGGQGAASGRAGGGGQPAGRGVAWAAGAVDGVPAWAGGRVPVPETGARVDRGGGEGAGGRAGPVCGHRGHRGRRGGGQGGRGAGRAGADGGDPGRGGRRCSGGGWRPAGGGRPGPRGGRWRGGPMTRHVLVARQDSKGDGLLARAAARAGPAVRAVAAGAGRVTLLCGPRGRDAGGLLPGVDDVVVAHAGWIDAEPRPVTRAAMEELVDRLVDLEIDQALVLPSFHQSPLPLALLLRMAGVPTIAAVSVDYPGSLLDVRHRVDEDIHEVERGLSLAATLGYRLPEGDDGGLRVRLDGRCDAPELEGPYVVVHPGVSVPARAWAPERHAALVDALGGAGRRGGGAERHAALVDALGGAGRRVVVTGDTSERPLTSMVAGGRRPGVVDLG